jgi:pimeloyl-ACP methyl ester carboxylesterase
MTMIPARRRIAVALVAALSGGPGAAAAESATVTIDGQRLHYEIVGAGGPTVVFESGLGADLSTWDPVAGPVSGFATVFLYDRAGLGESLPLAAVDVPVTAGAVAARLRRLLEAAGRSPPYILVGHSLGGLYVQMFARTYPDAVSGVLLLDASSPLAPDELKTLAELVPGTAEYLEEAGVPESNREVLAAGPFPDVPLIVIAATDHGPYFEAWEPVLMALQEDLARLSPQGRLVVAEGSGHDVHHDRADLVVDAIRALVTAAEGR